MWYEKNRQFQKEMHVKDMNNYVTDHHRAREKIRFQDKQNKALKNRRLRDLQNKFR